MSYCGALHTWFRRMNGVFVWRSLLTAGLTVMLALLAWIASSFVQVRDASILHTAALTQIEISLPRVWETLNDYGSRIKVLEVMRESEQSRKVQ